jgi:hypothetical protein
MSGARPPVAIDVRVVAQLALAAGRTSPSTIAA